MSASSVLVVALDLLVSASSVLVASLRFAGVSVFSSGCHSQLVCWCQRLQFWLLSPASLLVSASSVLVARPGFAGVSGFRKSSCQSGNHLRIVCVSG